MGIQQSGTEYSVFRNNKTRIPKLTENYCYLSLLGIKDAMNILTQVINSQM